MERLPVTSTNIASVGFDASTSMLEVEFKNGSVYDYAGATADQYAALQGSLSAGKYFAEYIRPQLHGVKVG